MRSARLLGISVAGGAVLIISAHLLAARVPASEPHAESSAESAVAGVFEGRTPCGQVATDFTGYPAATCEKIKWEITLYRDRASGEPASYQYRGTRTSRSGSWSIRRGAAHDSNATIYQLHYEDDRRLSLLPVGKDVLLLLDDGLHVLVGDASWSYTLNRTK